MMKVCPRCGCKFEALRKNKKYCSKECRTRDNSSNTYQKYKNDPEFIAQRKKTFLEWVKRNRKKYNIMQQVYRDRKEQREFGA